MNIYKSAVRLFLFFVVMVGVVYPVVITLISSVLMEKSAKGSLVELDGKVIGSKLIGQKFVSDKFFWPRPSVHVYDALKSGGSNLGATSEKLQREVAERALKLMLSHGLEKNQQMRSADIPVELLYASGSGLDPHISKQAAYFQVKRVAAARGVDEEQLLKLIDKMIERRVLGFIGEECVNVLLLNVELEKIQKEKKGQ